MRCQSAGDRSPVAIPERSVQSVGYAPGGALRTTSWRGIGTKGCLGNRIAWRTHQWRSGTGCGLVLRFAVPDCARPGAGSPPLSRLEEVAQPRSHSFPECRACPANWQSTACAWMVSGADRPTTGSRGGCAWPGRSKVRSRFTIASRFLGFPRELSGFNLIADRKAHPLATSNALMSEIPVSATGPSEPVPTKPRIDTPSVQDEDKWQSLAHDSSRIRKHSHIHTAGVC